MEYCGGPSALNMYAPAGLNYTAPQASSTTSTASVITATTSAVPSTVQTAGSYQFLACYNETSAGRTLASSSFANDSLTVEMCAGFCSGYTYFGVEYAREYVSKYILSKFLLTLLDATAEIPSSVVQHLKRVHQSLLVAL